MVGTVWKLKCVFRCLLIRLKWRPIIKHKLSAIDVDWFKNPHLLENEELTNVQSGHGINFPLVAFNDRLGGINLILFSCIPSVGRWKQTKGQPSRIFLMIPESWSEWQWVRMILFTYFLCTPANSRISAHSKQLRVEAVLNHWFEPEDPPKHRFH